MKGMWSLERKMKGSGYLLILISIFLIIWLLWPIKRVNQEILFQPGDLILKGFTNEYDATLDGQKIPVLKSAIKVLLEWSPVIRKGGSGSIKLQIIQDNNSSIIIGGHDLETSDETRIVNVFQVFSVIASARVDIAGVILDPPGEAGTHLAEGQITSFNWKISAVESGEYQGVIWLYLGAFGDDGTQVLNQAISAQNFDMHVISLFGLDVVYLWIIAFVILIIGALLLSDFRKSILRGKSQL